MQTSYTQPLGHAYEHMQRVLFRPFDLGKWFVVGFACWLARLTDGGGGFPSWILSAGDDVDAAGLSAETSIIPDFREIFGTEPWLVGCGAIGIALLLFLLLLIPLLLWLSSRSHFIYLDNVVHDRAEIQEPWSRLRAQGNSLFLWRLVFAIAVVVLMAASIGLIVFTNFYLTNRGSTPIGEIPAVFFSLLPMILTLIFAVYTHLFLIDFVVPIMHREGLTTSAAWRRFWPILTQHLASFLLYGLFILVLWFGITIGICVVIVFTCCIAAIPILIPYLSTVALLPIHVTFRAYSVAFLSQFLPSVGLPVIENTVAEPSMRTPTS